MYWHIFRQNRNKLNQYKPKTKIMLRWTAIFLVIAIVAAIFGFTGIAAGAASIAKTIFFVFLVLVLLSAILGATFFKEK